ncbi:DUF3108 domain-containing protein [Paracraurococcus lichenis]|uniref:DUF3108 domain-containing protein n=1 Tax=Paracraurococcus lichenis TaxID=3064888 RepID=A0ABT9E4Z4_9PROT|nr:DUF3108 domain-containing protein [Paracraurococcus sp. LOR1-02]MDO9711232.1 DUF3108 domain-containing protein [Paracraurococcus sp. LOR1-02]
MASSRRPLLAGCAAGLLALVPGAAWADPLLARYEIRFAGLHVMDVEAELDAGGPRYRILARTKSVGLAGALSRTETVTLAEGAWRGAEPMPLRYRLEGVWRGERREVAMDWLSPGQPSLQRLEPVEPDREPVPEPLRRGTMDTLSALAKLARAVTLTGRCEGAAAVYDGRRRSDVTAWTEGVQPLQLAGAFTGESLRCGFESRVLAGVRLDRDAEEVRKPQRATAWLARPLPDRPAIPVRIELPSRWLGTVRVTLTGVTPLRSGQELAQHRD